MNMSGKKSLNLSYSILNGAYWMAFCTISGYASVYLAFRAFPSYQIGLILAAGNILAAFLQPSLAAFADRTRSFSLSSLIMLLSSFGIGLLSLLLLTSGPSLFAGILFLLSVTVLQLVLPLVNSLSIYFINRGYAVNFGLARGIGSISYAVLSYLLGLFLQKYPYQIITLLSIVFFLLLMVTAFQLNRYKTNAVSHTLSQESKSNTKNGFLPFICKYKKFLCFIGGIVLIFLYHNAINTYLFQIMISLGGTSQDMGTSLAIAAAMELPTMLAFSYLIRKFPCHILLKTAVFFFSIKSVFFLFSNSIVMIHLSQCFQLLSFALYIPSSVYYVNEVMEEQDKVKGQAIATMVMTLGGLSGNLYGGTMIQVFGVKTMLFFGCIITFIGSVIVFLSTSAGKKEMPKAVPEK